MKPDLKDKIDKARQHLVKAKGNLDMGFADEAGRLAYLAAFDAAQAYVFFRTGKVCKTHGGVHDQFYLLVKEDPCFDIELKRFLPQTYEMKSIADYESGPSAIVPPERAIAAIAAATRFVSVVADAIDER